MDALMSVFLICPTHSAFAPRKTRHTMPSLHACVLAYVLALAVGAPFPCRCNIYPDTVWVCETSALQLVDVALFGLKRADPLDSCTGASESKGPIIASGP